MLLKELSPIKRNHLAWRLDHKTYCGLLSACRIARLETAHKELEVWKIFQAMGLTERSSKIHATKVINFKL